MSDLQRHQNGMFFKLSSEAALEHYKQTGDRNAWIADNVYNAAKLIADEAAIANRRAKPVAATLSVLQHVVKGAVDHHIDYVRDPDHTVDTHHTYFDDVRPYVVKHVQLHLHRLGLDEAATSAFKSLGLIRD